jgi:pimeloyl-ACP methyl ester carboxylesterase
LKRLFWVFLSIFLIVLIVREMVFPIIIATQATKAERHPIEDTPTRLGIVYEEVKFKARDGVQLRGWYLSNSEAKDSIIIVHGLDGNRADPGTGYLDIAAGLYKHGFNVLLFDLRGHGESDDGRLSGGLFEQEDVLGSYDWLRNHNPNGEIGLLGVALGGAISILAASREPGIRGLVADSAFADIRDMIKSEVPKRIFLPAWFIPFPEIIIAARLRYQIDLAKIVPENVIGNLGYPVLLIHCVDDERIPVEHFERLYYEAPKSSTWRLESCQHAQAFHTDPTAYIKEVSSYFNQRFAEAKLAEGSP